MACRVYDVFIHVLLPKNPLQVVGRNICPSLTTVFPKGYPRWRVVPVTPIRRSAPALSPTFAPSHGSRWQGCT